MSELGYTIFGQPFLGSSDNAGFLYVKPTYQVLATSRHFQYIIKRERLERFSYDLEMKRAKKTESTNERQFERFDWFIEQNGELCTDQWILRFDVILQHDWPFKQCLLHIRVFFSGKTKSPMF